MIRITDLVKCYGGRMGSITVLNHVNLVVERGEKIGLIGRNGVGKSTLVRLISGAEQPTSGTIERNMSVSWPLAFGGAFQSSLTGIDNVRFICRIYGRALSDVINYVDDFSELGRFLHEPVRTYSAGMRARLAFAISMIIDFDCFLIDEIIAVGDVRFQRKCHEELFVKRGDRAMIIASHDEGYIREHCRRAALLRDGNLQEFANIDEALKLHNAT